MGRATLNAEIRACRFRDRGIDLATVAAAQVVVLSSTRPSQRTPEGAYEDAESGARMANFFLPFVMVALMFMRIGHGGYAGHARGRRGEGQRIAEVLLGSVSPFELDTGNCSGWLGCR